MRRVLGLATLLLAQLAALLAWPGVLSGAAPGSPVYALFAVSADEQILVERECLISGSIHSNGDIDLKAESFVLGNATAVGHIYGSDSVGGVAVPAGPSVDLPSPWTPTEAREQADRTIEGNISFLTDQIVDDVLYVTGDVEFAQGLAGAGTVIAGGDIRLEEGGGAGFDEPQDPTVYLTLVAAGDVWVGKGRRLRGILLAGVDVDLEKGTVVEGTVVAGGTARIKHGAEVNFEAHSP